MLTPLLRRLRGWFPARPGQVVSSRCLPRWSEAMAEQHAAIWWKVKPYTMTSVERVVALCQAIAHVETEDIAGDIVECGVWKGGSVMAAALALLALDSTQRQIYLYDTFAGMTKPGECDIDWQGRSAHDFLRDSSGTGDQIRAECPLHEVKQTLMQTRYPWEKFVFVPGPVEETIPRILPERIALLRLDTDWHRSTRHELEYLFPRLAPGGILIVDDYGHWQGAKKAVDEYFLENGVAGELRAIDFTGRILIKASALSPALAA